MIECVCECVRERGERKSGWGVRGAQSWFLLCRCAGLDRISRRRKLRRRFACKERPDRTRIKSDKSRESLAGKRM